MFFLILSAFEFNETNSRKFSLAMLVNIGIEDALEIMIFVTVYRERRSRGVDDLYFNCTLVIDSCEEIQKK